MIGLLLAVLTWSSLARGMAPIAAPTPPATPQVPPLIGDVYPDDLDGNRISDELQQRSGSTAELSIAAASEAMVRVELIFREPVTQAQIDAFLDLGGRITYLFQAVSYGWTGLVPAGSIDLLPLAMGDTLVQVAPIHRFQAYMDTATQVGRVRPIWKPGFAGYPNGISGNSNITVGFIGAGVDATHADLKGRCVYWNDLTDEGTPSPVDFYGHDSLVAGIAVGTGEAGGADAGGLRYTMTDSYAYPMHLTDPIVLPSSLITVTSRATWRAGNAALAHVRWTQGTEAVDAALIHNYATGNPPITLTNRFVPIKTDLFSVMLTYYDSLIWYDDVVITTTVSSYPGVGDGYNKFRGVAPGCNWAAVRALTGDTDDSEDTFMAGLDDLVLHRIDKNIKIINISHGLNDDDGHPTENLSLRSKINSAVNNGIVVVCAAGNSAEERLEADRKMADPPRAAMAITVGAGNDRNALTSYSTLGYASPRAGAGEDYKPDVLAPGGSQYHTSIMSVDSGTADGSNADQEPNDYANMCGTSFAAPFVAGCAALVIEALEETGAVWDFHSADGPKLVKMLLCATASETNDQREGKDSNFDPALNRAAGGPNDFPAGKDPYEGYGLLNPDAAIEALTQTYEPGSTVTGELGGTVTAKRVWARTLDFKAGIDLDLSLENPSGTDFDLYLYSMVPGETGTPVLLASSTATAAGDDESLGYVPTDDMQTLLVVKCVSGSGGFTLRSIQAGPPTASDLQFKGGTNAALTITFTAMDDGRPNPPGALSYTIVSLPQHGQLESLGGVPITKVPAALANPADKVVYRPDPDWVGNDSFAFYAHDGGTAPYGGQSNTAKANVTIVPEVTVEYRIADGKDDAHGMKFSISQWADTPALAIGGYVAGLRFHNVEIPQGALIRSATLKICSYSVGLTGQFDGVLYAEDIDNSTDFNTTRLSKRTKTQASRAWAWDAVSPWTADTWYESPDITNLVQEVVDRTGWSSGNAMTLIYWVDSNSGSDRKIWAYEGNPDRAARLVITYQPR